jgi:phage portal protein BeeE
MNLLPWRRGPEYFDDLHERAFPTMSVSEYLNQTQFLYGGVSAQLVPSQTMPPNKPESVDPSFAGYIRGVYKNNGPIYTCMAVRMRLFSEARFQFTQMSGGRRGKLFGTPALGPLEVPWPGGTTGDLLARMIQQADLAGNSFVINRGDRLQILRPDWVDIVLALNERNPLRKLDKLGYAYWPNGRSSGQDPIVFGPDEVAHFAPNPDPEGIYAGFSWLTPVIQEVMADGAATTHKERFFNNAATPNMVVKVPEGVREEAFKSLIATFKAKHEGIDNAYKTLFLTSGADATVVGANFQQLEFKVTQGAGETRIAAAAEVPPVIAGFSEGLASATYSNYQLAMRRFVDLTMRPLWRNVAGSLATIIDVPANADLWYDDRDIPALHENARDEAEIDQIRAATIHSLITAGFEPDAVVATVNPEWSDLSHTGMLSVQLTPIGAVGEGKGSLVGGAVTPAEPAPASSNGDSANP